MDKDKLWKLMEQIDVKYRHASVVSVHLVRLLVTVLHLR